MSRRSRTSQVLHGDEGVAGVIVAITMVVLLGMVALSMDFVSLWRQGYFG